MNPQRIKWLFYGILLTALAMPRLGLLFNGLDSQRIWDTNTAATFSWMAAAKSEELGKFYRADQKYPLLGSYVFIPTTALYYGGARLLGIYENINDFIRAYALGDTALFFWLRLQMLAINAAAIYLLYRTVKRASPDAPRAAFYAILLSAADFYVTLFSVAPRIHSFAFAAGVLTLAAAYELLIEKSWKNYTLAFGAAALGASVSQSSWPLLVLPILAHFYSAQTERWSIIFSKKILFGIVFFVVAAIMLGYPRLLFAAFGHSVKMSEVLLSGQHSQPHFGLRAGMQFVFTYFVAAVPLTTWLLSATFWHTWCCERRKRWRLAPIDYLAVAHIIIFFLLFGLADVTTGRFTLAVMPSIILFLSRRLVQLEQKRFVWHFALALLAIQAYGVAELGMIAWRGDTRSEAAKFLLTHSARQDAILSTIDRELLGITPAPDSILSGDAGRAGAKDKLISDHRWQGAKSRPFTIWNPAMDKITNKDFDKFKYVVIASDQPARHLAEEKLLNRNFTLVKLFSATHRADAKFKASIPWDNISPPPMWSLALALRQFRSFGPTIIIYQHK